MKRIISLIMAGILVFGTAAMAKSDYIIGTNIEKMRRLVNESEFKIYAEVSSSKGTYYGAKFEPVSGSYLGTPYNVPFEGIANGVDTEYYWLELSDNIKNYNCPRVEKTEVPSLHKRLVGINWNFASKENVKLEEYSNYIYNFIDSLSVRGEDILLIFGKEMNIDDNFLNEDNFINAFRFVADYAHTKNNIAMVWAPNDTGGLDTTLTGFYPGDKYVDWIGCSLYSMPYFQGNPNSTETDNIAFIMGDYANPVTRAKVIAKFMDENNIKKPVMITEGGVGYESPEGERYIDWSMQQLRRYYGDLVRRYPQFKCIISFNNYVESGDYYRYDFGKCPELMQVMREQISDPIYLTSYPSCSEIAYNEIYDGMEFNGMIKLSAFAYIPKAEWLRVEYLVDGTKMGDSCYPPYKINIKAEEIGLGSHNLTVNMYSGNDCVGSRNIGFFVK